MLFNDCKDLPDHPIARVYRAMAQDSNRDKIDLGIGVYRNAQGASPIMACVNVAERRLAQTQTSKAYLTPDGNLDYCIEIEKLVLGSEHSVLQAKRLKTIQTPGGGGALRVGAELVKAVAPNASVWVSKPTWDHQIFVFESAGLTVKQHPYYDCDANRLLFEEMLLALETQTQPGDVLLLHGCCHNPTGEGLSQEQWHRLADVLARQQLLPFIDIAYQGFGDSLEDDVLGTQIVLDRVPEAVIATSSSKSFGIYRERAGAITVVFSDAGRITRNGGRLLSEVGRALYFMPPDRGAAMVAEILRDDDLTNLWRQELSEMCARLKELRRHFVDALAKHAPSWDFEYILRQKGMFSLLPLTQDDLLTLEERHSVYMMPDARINVAALTENAIERVAAAVAATLDD